MKNKKPSFIIYITRLSKQLHPKLNLSADAKNYLQNIINSFLDDFMIYISTMMDHNRVKTLSSRDIQSSVRLFFVGELAKHAISIGIKASIRFTSYRSKNSKKISNAKKAGIIFPPSRVRSILENELVDYKIDFRISSESPVYLAAVLEYLTAEILQVSSEECNCKKISVEDIKKGIEKDDELRRTLCRLRLD